MKQFLKDLSLYAVLFSIIGSGIWLRGAFDEDVLQSGMQLMHDKLMGMVQSESEKPHIQTLYNQFAERVQRREVSPEEVETVAANILNLSSTQAALTPEIAEDIFSLAAVPEVSLPANVDSIANAVTTAVLANTDFSVKVAPVPDSVWTNMGKNLKAVIESHEVVKSMAAAFAPDVPAPGEDFRVMQDFGHGLRLRVDPELREKIRERANRKERERFRRFEHDAVVVWDKSLEDSVRAARSKVRREMAVLHEMLMKEMRPDGQQVLAPHEMHELMRLARKKRLEALASAEGVPDSVAQIIDELIKLERKAPPPARRPVRPVKGRN